jgi:hypothetical protein
MRQLGWGEAPLALANQRVVLARGNRFENNTIRVDLAGKGTGNWATSDFGSNDNGCTCSKGKPYTTCGSA